MNEKNIALVLAAGQGKRMNTTVQKQFLEICRKPLLYYSLKCFQESPNIDEVVLVTGAENIEYCREEIVNKYGFDKVQSIVAGGKERYHSVYVGLKACKECQIVFIHDGARPFVDEKIIVRTLAAVKESGACVCAVKAKDTVKISDEQNFVKETPNRDNVWIVQTPQVFEYDLVYEAYHKCITKGVENITDDAMVVETMTQSHVRLVEGNYRNIKVTTQEDLKVAEAIIEGGH